MQRAAVLHGLILVGILMCLQGCILVPMVDSVQHTGVNSSGRQALLNETLTDFHHALFWGASSEALEFVSPSELDTMRTEFRTHRKEGRVVESNVELVDFSSDSYSAKVEVAEKYHDYATNIITPRLELEEWEYNFMDGWKLVSRKKGEG